MISIQLITMIILKLERARHRQSKHFGKFLKIFHHILHFISMFIYFDYFYIIDFIFICVYFILNLSLEWFPESRIFYSFYKLIYINYFFKFPTLFIIRYVHILLNWKKVLSWASCRCIIVFQHILKCFIVNVIAQLNKMICEMNNEEVFISKLQGSYKAAYFLPSVV